MRSLGRKGNNNLKSKTISQLAVSNLKRTIIKKPRAAIFGKRKRLKRNTRLLRKLVSAQSKRLKSKRTQKLKRWKTNGSLKTQHLRQPQSPRLEKEGNKCKSLQRKNSLICQQESLRWKRLHTRSQKRWRRRLTTNLSILRIKTLFGSRIRATISIRETISIRLWLLTLSPSRTTKNSWWPDWTGLQHFWKWDGTAQVLTSATMSKES